MPLLLNIDTATEFASVCLSRDEAVLAIEKSMDQKSHASFVQLAIKRIFDETKTSLSEIDAIAVTAGPGSYTGLRVGLSTAKGLCYALHKPLILVNTLEVMALACIDWEKNKEQNNVESFLFGPMIDARRMEVFTALYDERLNIVFEPQTLILSENSFADFLAQKTIIFSGSGRSKMRNICLHKNARFNEIAHDATHLSLLALSNYGSKKFADLAYSEPFYLKEFYTRHL